MDGTPNRAEEPKNSGETRPAAPSEVGLPAGTTPVMSGNRLLTLARQAESAREPAAASPGQGKQQNMVMVWPQLVSIEFVAMLVFTVMLLLLATLINAPLALLANPDSTPNPSKAPWYFLNLQELLLHMHPTLAGVIVPGGALALLAAIPYVDNTPSGTGRWFTSSYGKPIALFSMAYAFVMNMAMIFFNEYVGVRRILQPIGTPTFVIEMVIPLIAMFGLSWWLVVLQRRLWPQARDTRHALIALFSGFFMTYVLLTIIGTAFRGEGMHLFWPWDVEIHGLYE